MKQRDEAVINLMREIAWFMEWNGDLASAELADMQREICRWRRSWPREPARPILAFRALQMSNRVLELSGFLELEGPERCSGRNEKNRDLRNWLGVRFTIRQIPQRCL
jgi:hypothetical protein